MNSKEYQKSDKNVNQLKDQLMNILNAHISHMNIPYILIVFTIIILFYFQKKNITYIF